MKKIILIALSFASLTVSAQAFANYEAVAYNAQTQTWGTARGYWSAQAAVDAAIQACGYGCRWLAWSENGCVALANNPAGDYGWAYGYSNPTDAVNGAVSACNTHGTGWCTWRAWACN